MPTPRQCLLLLQHMGPGWLLYRAGYAMRRRCGFLRRASPAVAWEQVPAPALALRKRATLPVSPSWGAACVSEAEAILRGEFRLFSHRVVEAGFPPNWHANQLTKNPQVSDLLRHLRAEHSVSPQVSSSLQHWSDISDYVGGDIKGVWELSRFSWAYPLARAHARTSDARFATAFWQLFADWCRRNPPSLGPNWMCGQEATFRLMAVVFAAEAMEVPVEQRSTLARFVVATGRRIAANLDYALSQKNNHGVSECIGLITVALLVPEHAESTDWLTRGLKELEAQLRELVYEDGGFSQHSLIYHRVLLHDLCWCRSRLITTEQVIPQLLDAAERRALDFLMTLVDPATGQAPLYGANDGSNVLPLSDGEFLDLRPVVQMAAAAFRSELPLPEGPWDEAAAWLTPDWNSLPRLPWPATSARWHAPVAGYFQLTQGRDRLFLRCPTVFRHRPSQADMLHVDVWHDGRPIAMDGGSFSYNSRERFVALGTAGHHNVLTVDGKEPMRKFSRFHYLPWPRGEAGEAGEGVFRASHDGYADSGLGWTREVAANPGGGFTVCDKLTGTAGRTVRWHWRLCDGAWQIGNDGSSVTEAGRRYTVRWHSPAKISSRLIRADETTAFGWWSPYYGSAEPCAALLLEVQAGGDVELVTEFSPQE